MITDDSFSLIDADSLERSGSDLKIPRGMTSLVLESGARKVREWWFRSNAVVQERRLDESRVPRRQLPQHGAIEYRLSVSTMSPPGTRSVSGLWDARSLGALTGIDTLLQRIFLHEGTPRCRACGAPMTKQGVTEFLDLVDSLPASGVVLIAVPVHRRGQAGMESISSVLEMFGSERFIRDQRIWSIADWEAQPKHSRVKSAVEEEPVAVVVDTIPLPLTIEQRVQLGRMLSRLVGFYSQEVSLYHFESRRALGREIGKYGSAFRCRSCRTSMPPITIEAVLAAGSEIKRPRSQRRQIRPGEVSSDAVGYPAEIECHGLSLSAHARYTPQQLQSWLAGMIEAESSGSYRLLTEAKRIIEALLCAGLSEVPLSLLYAHFSSGERVRFHLVLPLVAALSDLFILIDESLSIFSEEELADLRDVFARLTATGNTCCIFGVDDRLSRVCEQVIRLSSDARLKSRKVVEASVPAMRLTRPALWRSEQMKQWVSELELPVGELICMSGDSGAGKTQLLRELSITLGRTRNRAPRVILPDFSRAVIFESETTRAVARPAQTLAGYLGFSSVIADLYARTLSARMNGLELADFIPEKSRHRCEGCHGSGIQRTEHHDYAEGERCPQCEGELFRDSVPAVLVAGRSIAAMLRCTLSEIGAEARFNRPIQVLIERCVSLGLGELQLGLPLSALTQSEWARVQLAVLLPLPTVRGKRRRSGRTGATLYLLDLPFLGLNEDEVERAVAVLREQTNTGDTVICVDSGTQCKYLSDRVIELTITG